MSTRRAYVGRKTPYCLVLFTTKAMEKSLKHRGSRYQAYIHKVEETPAGVVDHAAQPRNGRGVFRDIRHCLVWRYHTDYLLKGEDMMSPDIDMRLASLAHRSDTRYPN
ncbi:hypothetical protein EVAR_81208_1 [Eumeta japonica]|uniref:Uncharacterized protein n=1 Tax=Eumeta variegata TaxID=151549 RepID=A0A4C1V0X6_EUMVA|nr:hypothetical protein EVAR_81208_1 [Eumeta japonica]